MDSKRCTGRHQVRCRVCLRGSGWDQRTCSATGFSTVSGKVEEDDDHTFLDPAPLFDAVAKGDLDGVKAALDSGIDVNAVQEVRCCG